MASLRLRIDDTVIFEGPPIAVPRVGEEIRRSGEVGRIESVVWDFEEEDGVVIVTLVVGDRPYTY